MCKYKDLPALSQDFRQVIRRLCRRGGVVRADLGHHVLIVAKRVVGHHRYAVLRRQVKLHVPGLGVYDGDTNRLGISGQLLVQNVHLLIHIPRLGGAAVHHAHPVLPLVAQRVVDIGDRLLGPLLHIVPEISAGGLSDNG